MRALPSTIAGFIEEYEKLYPPRCIGVDQTPQHAHHYAGKVALVQEMRARLMAVDKKEKSRLDSVL